MNWRALITVALGIAFLTWLLYPMCNSPRGIPDASPRAEAVRVTVSMDDMRLLVVDSRGALLAVKSRT